MDFLKSRLYCTENFLVRVIRGRFSKKSWKIFKKFLHEGLNGIKIKIVKKFGVCICIFQSTAGDQYHGEGTNLVPPLQVGLRNVKVGICRFQIIGYEMSTKWLENLTRQKKTFYRIS